MNQVCFDRLASYKSMNRKINNKTPKMKRKLPKMISLPRFILFLSSERFDISKSGLFSCHLKMIYAKIQIQHIRNSKNLNVF